MNPIVTQITIVPGEAAAYFRILADMRSAYRKGKLIRRMIYGIYGMPQYLNGKKHTSLHARSTTWT